MQIRSEFTESTSSSSRQRSFRDNDCSDFYTNRKKVWCRIQSSLLFRSRLSPMFSFTPVDQPRSRPKKFEIEQRNKLSTTISKYIFFFLQKKENKNRTIYICETEQFDFAGESVRAEVILAKWAVTREGVPRKLRGWYRMEDDIVGRYRQTQKRKSETDRIEETERQMRWKCETKLEWLLYFLAKECLRVCCCLES